MLFTSLLTVEGVGVVNTINRPLVMSEDVKRSQEIADPFFGRQGKTRSNKTRQTSCCARKERNERERRERKVGAISEQQKDRHRDEDWDKD